MSRSYGCYGYLRLAKHGKTQDGRANVTDVTDVTENRRGCTYRAFAGARGRAGYVNTPLSDSVTSVTLAKITPRSCGFHVTPGRNIGDHVTPVAFCGVVC